MKTIIMAGGSGTRLWPLSRSRYPKQFLKIKDMSQSLFQMTINRCLNLCKLQDIYVLTVKEYEFIIQSQLEEMKYSKDALNVLLEPQPKNTLPAIYNAVKKIKAEFGNDIVTVFPSDHLIDDTQEMISQIENSYKYANRYIYSFGIKPTGPVTGFGYIMPGEKLEAGYKIAEFKEKPDKNTAIDYVNNGYYWNSGMFMFSTELFEKEVKEHAPEVYEAFSRQNIEECFEGTPNISIDYGIMEKSKNTAVLPLKISWDDLGSFATFYDTYSKYRDEQGNVALNQEIMLDSTENLAYIEDKKACMFIGVNNLIVVDQGDAILICNKNHAQNVKEAYAVLMQRKDSRAELHLTEYRPWGSFKILENGDFYKIKRLTVLPGKQLSYQMHYHRSEHWIVVSGTATVTVHEKNVIVHTGESIFINAGDKHRLQNNGKLLLEVIEVQTGQYLGEDDIVRIYDDFGRC